MVRVSYWQADSREKVEQALTQVRQERGVPVETVWLVHYYPETDPVGIVEFLLKPDEETLAAEQTAAANELPEEKTEK